MYLKLITILNLIVFILCSVQVKKQMEQYKAALKINSDLIKFLLLS